MAVHKLNNVTISHGQISSYVNNANGVEVRKVRSYINPIKRLSAYLFSSGSIRVEVNGQRRYVSKKSVAKLLSEQVGTDKKAFSKMKTAEKISALQKAFDGSCIADIDQKKYWDKLSIEAILAHDFSKITQKSFNEMKAALGNKGSKDLFQKLDQDQLSLLCRFFSKDDFGYVIDRIPELDLTGINKDVFKKMCSDKDRSVAILQKLKSDSLNCIYPYFSKEQWEILDPARQIRCLKFDHMNEEIFAKMCPPDSVRTAQVFNELTSAQLVKVAPFVTKDGYLPHHRALCDRAKKGMIFTF